MRFLADAGFKMFKRTSDGKRKRTDLNQKNRTLKLSVVA